MTHTALFPLNSFFIDDDPLTSIPQFAASLDITTSSSTEFVFNANDILTVTSASVSHKSPHFSGNAESCVIVHTSNKPFRSRTLSTRLRDFTGLPTHLTTTIPPVHQSTGYSISNFVSYSTFKHA